MRRLASVPLVLALTLPLAAQVPGERPPPAVVASVRPALDAARRAMAAGDAAGVRAATDAVIKGLGAWAGNPETATRYYPPVDRRAFEVGAVRTWWEREVQRHGSGAPWLKNPKGDPKVMTSGLREAAWMIDALTRSAALYPASRDAWLARARAGGDWLLRLQRPNGVFPFPVGPALHPREKVGQIVARAIKDRPELVVDGWITTDEGDGGLQFDHGLCGHALLDLTDATHEARYLAAAERAADWATAQPLVSNWNYNAFSVGLLAHAARVTGKAKYLEAAIRKADIGVLPGQMPAGRWFDAHNACAVYHNILLRELLELLHSLPADHPFRPKLMDAVTRGLNQAAEETLTHGYTGTWTDNFARGLQWIGNNPRWTEALNTNVNAAGRHGAPNLGVAAVSVLEFAAAAERADVARPGVLPAQGSRR